MQHYLSSVNRVIDHIDANIESPLRLRTLSRIARCSPYHFHRIFKAVTKEPLNQYVQRQRIEKAAMHLVVYPNKSITEVAFDAGYSSTQYFARAFKRRFGVNARDWRQAQRKDVHINSKIVHAGELPIGYREIDDARKERMVQRPVVEIRDLPDMPVVYVRHIGQYKGDFDLYERMFSDLFKWAGARDLLRFPETKVIALYNEIPNITEEDKLRLTACITVDGPVEVDGHIGQLVIAGGRYAIGKFEIATEQFEDAWDFMYEEWLPDSGYVPDDKPAFEVLLGDPRKHPEGKHLIEICLPVVPL